MNDQQRDPAETREPVGASAASAPGQAGAPGQADAPRTFKDVMPWEGKATTADKVLLGFLFGVPLFYLVLLPLRPFLIAQMPVILAAVTGAKTVVASAGAFAAVDGFPLWVVILAGTFGMVKFDWLFWYAGVRWGSGIVRLFAQNEKQRKQLEYIRKLPRWLVFIVIFFARWPGVPGPIANLVAGWSKMPAWMFFLGNILGAVVLATACASVGFAIGQPAVDFLRTIDKYALWVSLAIIVGAGIWSSRKAKKSTPPTSE